MKKKHDPSWKALQQKPRWTWQRARRVLLRAGMVVGLIASIGFVLWRTIGKTDTVQPLEQIFFSTDGVLQKNWFLANVKVPFGEGLMAIDLNSLQHYCLQYKQIKEVEIAREFPDALRIQVKEHRPCAKVLLVKNGKRSVGLVSEEGVIFEPVQYDRQQIAGYPTLSDVPKTLMQDGKIVGFRSVFRLLQFLNSNAPDVFQAVRGLSLRHYDPFLERKWQSIEFDIGGTWTLVFPIEQPEAALAKLRSILRSLSPHQRKNLRRLNVAATRPTVEFL